MELSHELRESSVRCACNLVLRQAIHSFWPRTITQTFACQANVKSALNERVQDIQFMEANLKGTRDKVDTEVGRFVASIEEIEVGAVTFYVVVSGKSRGHGLYTGPVVRLP